MSDSEAHIIEQDEAGRICGRYTSTLAVIPEVTSGRPNMWESVTQLLSDVFMPAGYPVSVSADYLEYQLFDSLQAFSSSIAGLLASRAVLEGVGVGDSTASATNALLLTIAQDTVGRLATILFAWRIGTALEPEAKRYRLLADIFNDSAMILDCLSPALPVHARVLSLCASGALRALCGVAAGGAKAALSVHFARANNVGDLNAKDSSQETVIGLLGMLAGSFVVSKVTSRAASWTLLLTLITIHLSTNYLAVRAIVMRTFNRQRMNIAYAHFLKTKTVPPPQEVAAREHIFASGDALQGPRLGRCEIGVPLRRISPDAGVLNIFSTEQYILSFTAAPRTSMPSYAICLKKGAGGVDQLKAWSHAIELANLVQKSPKQYDRLGLLVESLAWAHEHFSEFLKAAVRAGWDTDYPALMTRPAFRISPVVSDKKSKNN